MYLASTSSKLCEIISWATIPSVCIVPPENPYKVDRLNQVWFVESETVKLIIALSFYHTSSSGGSSWLQAASHYISVLSQLLSTFVKPCHLCQPLKTFVNLHWSTFQVSEKGLSKEGRFARTPRLEIWAEKWKSINIQLERTRVEITQMAQLWKYSFETKKN